MWIFTIPVGDGCTFWAEEQLAVAAPDADAAREQLAGALRAGLADSIHAEIRIGQLAFCASQVLTEGAWQALVEDAGTLALLCGSDIGAEVVPLATWLADRTLTPATPASANKAGHKDDYYHCHSCDLELLGEDCAGFTTRATYANGHFAGCPSCGAMNPAPEPEEP